MNIIRSYRERHGLSQAQFGQLVGVRQTAVSNYEQGIRAPHFRVAKRISDKTHGEVSIHALRPDVFGPAPSPLHDQAA